MVEVSASILSVEKQESLKTFYNLEAAKINYFHIDVMDGKFVKNNTLDLMIEYVRNIKNISNLPLDIHLMVEDVKSNINDYLDFNPNIITFHLEACKDSKNVSEIIDYIKQNNIKVGIAIKPETKIEEVFKYLPFIHMVLIMTVEPGYGGQKLIPETIEKVSKLKNYIEKNNLELDIEVDGGINLNNADELKKAGSNIMVVGSSLVNSENYTETVKELCKI